MDLVLLNVDAVQLPETPQEIKYSRIEVRNLKYAGRYLMAFRYRISLMPGIWVHEKPSALLQPPHQNTYATIMSAYLNAVMEMVKRGNDRNPGCDKTHGWSQ